MKTHICPQNLCAIFFYCFFYDRLTERVTDYELKMPFALHVKKIHMAYPYIRQVQTRKTAGNLRSMCNVCKLKPRSCKIQMARLSSFYHRVWYQICNQVTWSRATTIALKLNLFGLNHFFGVIICCLIVCCPVWWWCVGCGGVDFLPVIIPH